MEDFFEIFFQIVFMLVLFVGQYIIARAKKRKVEQLENNEIESAHSNIKADFRNVLKRRYSSKKDKKTDQDQNQNGYLKYREKNSNAVAVISNVVADRQNSLRGSIVEQIKIVSSLIDICNYKSFWVLKRVFEQDIMSLLNKTLRELDDVTDMNASRLDDVEADINYTFKMIDTASMVIKDRKFYDSNIWNALDLLAGNTVSIFKRHFDLSGLKPIEIFNGAVVETSATDEKHGLYSSIVIGEECINNPSLAAASVYYGALSVYKNIYNRTGEIITSLGLPDAAAGIYYFQKTGKVSFKLLAVHMLDSIFADTVAALKIGRSHGDALVRLVRNSSSDDKGNSLVISAGGKVKRIPFIIRLNVALIAAETLQLEDTESLKQSIQDLCQDDKTGFVFNFEGYNSVYVDEFYNELKAMVLSFIYTPFNLFGGIPLLNINGLSLIEADLKNAENAATGFARKKRQNKDNIFIYPVAFEIACSKSAAIENMLAKQMINAISHVPVSLEGMRSSNKDGYDSFYKAAGSPSFWVDAIALGVISKNSR